MLVKTPTSSLTANELLANILWYRGLACIKWLFYGGTPGTSTAHSSPVTKLPRELVEMIISYLIYDTRTLLACSLTCYPWYIATVPYLHYSLTTDNDGNPWPYWGRSWPKPLRKSYELGLLPLVRRFRIRSGGRSSVGLTPEWLGRRTLRYFLALTNLQELGIDNLQVSDFMPTIQQCFGHFSPTLRFLALKKPNGSCRQILYLIGLFSNLQDLKLIYFFPDEQENITDATLVPPSIPPLQGRLTLTHFKGESLMKDMITLFGGLRFRYMDLFRVDCVRLLLDACVETLETLRLYPTDTYDDDRALLQHFNISRNKSLRTLETTAQSITVAGDNASNFLRTILSTITSPAPFDVVIVYRDVDLGGIPSHCWRCEPDPVCFRHYGWYKGNIVDAPRYKQHLIVFREMHKAWQDFRLVLCADVFDCMVEHGIQTLEDIVDAGGLDYLFYKPLIICERRTPRTRVEDYQAGWSATCLGTASAL